MVPLHNYSFNPSDAATEMFWDLHDMDQYHLIVDAFLNAIY